MSTAHRYATTAAGVYMEQCVHALKMCALRPLRETTYLRVQVHVTAYCMWRRGCMLHLLLVEDDTASPAGDAVCEDALVNFIEGNIVKPLSRG